MTWSDPILVSRPVASAIGPFARPEVLAEIAVAAADPGLQAVVSASGGFVVSVDGTVVRLAGHADLCDYHTPVGGGIVELVGGLVADLGPGFGYQFDSLPQEAAEVFAAGFVEAGLKVSMTEHISTAVLCLPPDFDSYLHAIGKKQRHELRRKRRRYEELVGEVRFESATGAVVEDFILLHRRSPGAKGTFMDERMAGLFRRLVCLDGWRIDLLRHPDSGVMLAALFVYVDEEGYFLYNSAFDPELREASPGNVILARVIEEAISAGLSRFDFLKGEEEYKYRLGAKPRPLYRVEARS